MAHYTPTEQFVRRLTEYQNRLYAYILALLGDANAVDDVLQETNMTLWRKAEEFIEGSSFGAWASRVAYYEVLAYRKRRHKDRHVFDEAMMEQMAGQIVQETESIGTELATLHRCIEKLSQLDRELVRGRYSLGGSVKQLAELRSKSAGAISQALYRIRNELADCVEQALAADGKKGDMEKGKKASPSPFLTEDGP